MLVEQVNSTQNSYFYLIEISTGKCFSNDDIFFEAKQPNKYREYVHTFHEEVRNAEMI